MFTPLSSFLPHDLVLCPTSLHITPFSAAEVSASIARLNLRKAPGYDLIAGKVLQELPPAAVGLLTTIYNSILRLSYYPLLWKFAQIVMLPKPGKPPYDVASYRPISLLPIASKVFEKLLLKRLRSDVEISHVIPSYQFGFRTGHSPIQQAHRVVNETVTSLEERALCTAVFLDVAQAFDKVWHIGLLYKLKNSLPGPYYLLLQSYLSDRYFQIRYNGMCNESYEVRSGVPQGGVLGHLLCLLFTADLQPTDYTTIATFARGS